MKQDKRKELKKKEIIFVIKEAQKGLKKNEIRPLATSQIASKIKANNQRTADLLLELEKESKIRLVFESHNGFKYWGLP